jgi:Leucine-rich repeat (LRR) protein
MTDTEHRPAPPPATRWCHLRPDRFLIGLLAVEGFLFLSDRFHWFGSNKLKGWLVLTAVAAAALVSLFILPWLAAGLLGRRRFRSGIRSLSLLAVAIAIPCAWLANEMRWAERQREALQAICEIRYASAFEQPGQLGCPADWARRVFGDDFFLTVHYVFLGGPDATDALLEKLRGLRELRKLNLDQTQITDAGLEHLAGLSQLQELSIAYSPVTDAGLEHIKGLTELRELYLNSTQASDAGLEHLKGLSRLRVLWLHGTKFTHAGVEKLQQALPNCKIEHY